MSVMRKMKPGNYKSITGIKLPIDYKKNASAGKHTAPATYSVTHFMEYGFRHFLLFPKQPEEAARC